MNPNSVVALIRLSNPELVVAISRRGKPDDLGLPGGKIEFGETPDEAVQREVKEETGLDIIELNWILDREDVENSGYIARCYAATCVGIPKTVEDGCEVSVVHFSKLLEPQCTFRNYNDNLFRKIGLIK